MPEQHGLGAGYELDRHSSWMREEVNLAIDGVVMEKGVAEPHVANQLIRQVLLYT